MKGRVISCPRCESKKVGQFRHPTGAMWCANCGFRTEHKETHNPFIIKDTVKPIRFKESF